MFKASKYKVLNCTAVLILFSSTGVFKIIVIAPVLHVAEENLGPIANRECCIAMITSCKDGADSESDLFPKTRGQDVYAHRVMIEERDSVDTDMGVGRQEVSSFQSGIISPSFWTLSMITATPFCSGSIH